MIKTTLFCLSLVMYREARSEGLDAQIATAKILQNRATIRKTSVCGELAKAAQFSWVKSYRIVKPKWDGSVDWIAWEQAAKTARCLNNLSVKGITPKHIYFNTLAMGKRYKTKTKTVRIGQLLFY
jgi:spore germination cell wall hydrolase CwlJ-like protein